MDLDLDLEDQLVNARNSIYNMIGKDLFSHYIQILSQFLSGSIDKLEFEYQIKQKITTPSSPSFQNVELIKLHNTYTTLLLEKINISYNLGYHPYQEKKMNSEEEFLKNQSKQLATAPSSIFKFKDDDQQCEIISRMITNERNSQLISLMSINNRFITKNELRLRLMSVMGLYTVNTDVSTLEELVSFLLFITEQYIRLEALSL